MRREQDAKIKWHPEYGKCLCVDSGLDGIVARQSALDSWSFDYIKFLLNKQYLIESENYTKTKL